MDQLIFQKETPQYVLRQLTNDFEMGIGMWNSQGTLQWTRRSGGTPSSNTGPSADHTTGSGKYYIYLEATGASTGDQAELVANTQSASDSCVMNFYYHMHGSSMGKLEVKLDGNVVFDKSGDQGNQWKHGSVNIPKGNAAIKIVATRGNDFTSDIAIDDIIFNTGCSSTIVAPGQLTNYFETGIGMWNSQGTLQWTRRSGGTPSSSTGPSADHTTGSGKYYIYLEATGASTGDQAELAANTQSASDSCVMNFYYHMHGSSMGKLEVKLDGNVVFDKSGDQGNQWKHGSVNIPKGNAAIKIVATRGNDFTSDIAIDDIIFNKGCSSTIAPGQLTNDFETGIGMWNSQGTLQWTRRSGGTPSSNTGPSADHTTGSGKYYIYLEATGASTGDQAELVANTQSASDSCVMNFYYHMHGSSMGKLEVKLDGNVVFDKSGDQGNQWKHGSVNIPKGNAAIKIVATRGNDFTSDIAIDDIIFNTGCSSTIVAPGQLTNYFETGIGMWNSQGTLQWTRRSGGTPSSSTGPSADHTTGSGKYYIYLEATGASTGDQAELAANTQSASDSCVMNFYYHMHGSSMGKLEVKLDGNVVFDKSGDQGNQWKHGSVNIPKGNATIKIVATRGNDFTSDIAIDDIIFNKGCSSTIAPGQLTNDFETGIGMWNSQGTLQWTRRSGGTPSSNTGPSADHTTGSGKYYIYLEATGASTGDQAELVANTQSASDSCVMNFYYHMHGSSMGKLEVKLDGNVVFDKSGDQGNQWKHGSVNIPKGNAAIKIVATRGNDFTSDIAIDDIIFNTGCSSTIVAPGQLTNYFETGIGMWNSQGTLQWTRRSGGTPSSSTGPSADHTTGSGKYYIYLEATGASTGDQAELAANTQSASDSCVMNFYYHMHGSSMGKLEVKLDGNVVFDKSGDQGNQWKHGSVNIPKGNATIKIVATRGNDFTSDIAIDDIIFNKGCSSTIAPGQLTNDFETGIGMWNSQGTLQWTRRSGGTPSSSTGPSADHTTGSGKYYIYLEATGASTGDQAELAANTQSASDSCVMNFYYHMYGSSMGKLEVKINTIVVFHNTGDQGNQWKQGRVPIAKGNTTIQFVATREGGDDLNVLDRILKVNGEIDERLVKRDAIEENENENADDVINRINIELGLSLFEGDIAISDGEGQENGVNKRAV
ncbi:MAM and LDL-receptor class A domain-containing protein 1-like [Tubulanus polymorphus]|uniref:MAM and LDL-receptor class A domain-containing protein 1-like n=1 Tax=Tubulanus polymorphus TaxID=672921 RepID=UPI003DA4006A